MRVLITGAAGMVGGILRPALEAEHDCRFLDLVAPDSADDRWIRGSLLDAETRRRVMDGVEAVVHLVMGDCTDVVSMYDVNVKGLHLMLEAATRAGVTKVVYASSMSVFGVEVGFFGEEADRVPDSVTDYGLTKRLSETVGEAFTVRHPSLSFIALRLYMPVTDEAFATVDEGRCITAPDDLRRAFLAALACERRGFHAVSIASDLTERWMPMGKARELLGWVPRRR